MANGPAIWIQFAGYMIGVKDHPLMGAMPYIELFAGAATPQGSVWFLYDESASLKVTNLSYSSQKS